MTETRIEATDRILKSNPNISGPELHKELEGLNQTEEKEQHLTPMERMEMKSIAEAQCKTCKLRCPHPKEERHTCDCECKLENQIGICLKCERE